MRSLLLVGALVAAAASVAASPTSLIAEKGGVRVTLLPTVAPATASEAVKTVALDIEALTDDAATRLGSRSVRALVSIDCGQPSNRFDAVTAYSQPQLQGEGQVRPVSGAWIHPSPDSVMLDVVQRLCAGATASAAPPPVVVAAAPTPPPTPVAPVPTAPAPAAPIPASPPAPDVASSQTPAPSAEASVAVAAAKPEVVPMAAPVSKPALKPGDASSSATPAIAQVAASPTARGAQRVLDALKSLIAPPLTGSVEPAMVQGVQVYRANVSGFASIAEANAFCAKAKPVAKGCWVRPAPRTQKPA